MTDRTRNGHAYNGIYPDFTLAQLEAMPTITVGQADDLKLEYGRFRVWLSRVGIEDGAPWDNMVTVETLVGGSWIEVEWYEAQ